MPPQYCIFLFIILKNSWQIQDKKKPPWQNGEYQSRKVFCTNYGYSDWATIEIPSGIKTMWHRLSRREDDFCIENSRDGKTFHQMRICHFFEAQGEINFGIYACSPEDSSFKAVFTDFILGECMWKAHTGQAPDEE